jgi:hypothetical protein
MQRKCGRTISGEVSAYLFNYRDEVGLTITWPRIYPPASFSLTEAGRSRKAGETMKKIMKSILQIIYFFVATTPLGTSYTLAQEEGQPPDLGLSCVTKSKGYTVHFTAYQQRDVAEMAENPGMSFQPYCQEIPEVGLTYITLDLVDHYTRNQPVAVRIVEAALKKPGTIEELRTILEVPEEKYRSGTIELKVDFDTPALYAAVLTIGGEEINIPVRVGIEKEAPLIRRLFPIFFGILVLAALGYAAYYFKYFQGSKQQKVDIGQNPKADQERKEEKDKA